MATNTCVCCGAEIPEGLQVCPNCGETARKLKFKNHAHIEWEDSVMFWAGVLAGAITTAFVYLILGGS